jgi:hypothetical protein
MVKHTSNVVRVEDLPAREQEIIYHQKMIEHARHQNKVGRQSVYRRYQTSHSKYVIRLAHYLSKPRPFSVRHWVAQLREGDFRAYQAKLAGIDISDHASYFWWFNLGDEQRYRMIREGSDAVRDEYEQEKKYRFLKKLKTLRESGEA